MSVLRRMNKKKLMQIIPHNTDCEQDWLEKKRSIWYLLHCIFGLSVKKHKPLDT